MHLLAPPNEPVANLQVIRETLEKYAGDAVVRFERGIGAAELVWRDPEGAEAVSISRIPISLQWLGDSKKAPKIELATRFLATDVLATVNRHEVVSRPR